jgi:hypothetical protein
MHDTPCLRPPAAWFGLALLAGAAACGHAQGDVELSAQAVPNEPVSSANASEPSSAAEPPATAPEAPAPPQPVVTEGWCNFTCLAARPTSRTLSDADIASLKSAMGPTMTGIRQCAIQENVRHRTGPILNLRFGETGDLVDLGVDATGFDDTVSSCFENVVRGSMALPQVKLEGPRATIRCSEKCDRKTFWGPR